MTFFTKRPYVIFESRGNFFKQTIRWTVLHLLSFAISVTVFYHGVDTDSLGLQFFALVLLLALQGLLFTFLDKILNVEGRVLDIYQDAPRFCSKHLNALMLVPLAGLAFVIYLCLKKKGEGKAPFFLARPHWPAEFCLGLFVFTIVTPILSLVYPSVRLDSLNFWIATPGAFTITQTVDAVRSIGLKAHDPQFLQVSDLGHGVKRPSFYVSALTFDLIQKRILNDLPKVRTRLLAADSFERELSYVENLFELMKWADNTRTMFSYFHKAYLFPSSGWDTSVVFFAEHYFLYSFKLQIHQEVEQYFKQLDRNLVSLEQKEKLQRLEQGYYQIKTVRALKPIEGTWMEKFLRLF